MVSNYERQAGNAYNSQDYGKAIKFYDRAIGLTPSVRLYDNRAACYEKLGELNHALQDAGKAVQLDRRDPTGFLRAGQILVKRNEKQAALQTYQRGLKHVHPASKNYKVCFTPHR